MIKPQIVNWHSPDVLSVWTWVPESLNEVYYLLEVTIGSSSGTGELFDVTIASPQAILNKVRQPVLCGRHHLIVLEYSWQNVKEHIQEIVSRCEAETWEKCAQKLSRYFHWEYEDYKIDGVPV